MAESAVSYVTPQRSASRVAVTYGFPRKADDLINAHDEIETELHDHKVRGVALRIALDLAGTKA